MSGPNINRLSPSGSSKRKARTKNRGVIAATAAAAGSKRKAKKKATMRRPGGGGGKGQQMNPGQGVPVQPRKEKNP